MSKIKDLLQKAGEAVEDKIIQIRFLQAKLGTLTDKNSEDYKTTDSKLKSLIEELY